MTKRYFSGPTEAQAILEAATHFGLAPEEVAFEPVSRKGSLRARTKSIIAVDDEAPKRVAAPEAAAAEVAPSTPLPREEPGPADEVQSVTGEDTAETLAEPASAPAPPEVEPAEAQPAPAPPVEVEPASVGPEPAPSASAAKEPPAEIDPEEVRGRIVAAMEALLDLADLDVDPVVETGGDLPTVNVTGPDREWLLDGEGDLLLALEHLVGRMLYRSGSPVDRVRVDSDGYREAQDEALRKRARQALEESADTGKPVVFEPLPPAERRVVHLAVEASGLGWSRSEGSGYRRRVRVEATAETAGSAEVSPS